MAQPQGCHKALYDTTCLLYPGGCVSVTVYPGHAEGIATDNAKHIAADSSKGDAKCNVEGYAQGNATSSRVNRCLRAN